MGNKRIMRWLLIYILIAVPVFLLRIILANLPRFFVTPLLITYDNSQITDFLPKLETSSNDEDSDFTKLIDLHGFKFLMNHECESNGISPSLLVLVSTRTWHFKHREAIRKTWGSIVDDRFKVFFLLGISSVPKLQELMIAENDEKNDIIQGNFLDSYKNLTYKTVMGLKYVKYFCPNAKLILKIDDDIFFNSPRVMKFINRGLYPNGPKDSFFCLVEAKGKPVRDAPSKAYVSFSQYPGKYYPRHCSGRFYFFPSSIVPKLYKEAQKTKYFHIEDIFLTGFVAAKANLRISNHGLKLMWLEENLENITNNKNFETFAFSTKELKPEEMSVIWELVPKS